MSSTAEKRERFGEPAKFLPVAFVVSIIVSLWTIYVFYHLIPMFQWDLPQERRNQEVAQRALIEMIIFQYITIMLILCYVRSILVHPGEIPDDDPHWNYPSQDGKMSSADDKDKASELNLQELKRTGERRHCKWCGKYKPDRCHHCRVCRTCILKMDHHCPWIYNCVGFKNHKFFFLLLWFTVLDCHMIAWTMFESVQASVEVDTPFLTMFLLLFGETLSSFLGILVTAFFCFHIWLMFKAMTTIEFCEKSLKKVGYKDSPYDHGMFGNITTVLGPNPLLWFFPVSNPQGDGLTFVTEHTRLNVDMEAGRAFRKKGHKTTQRASHSRSRGRAAESGSDSQDVR
jgi:hypothetical protein